jgi:hypothetical protein
LTVAPAKVFAGGLAIALIALGVPQATDSFLRLYADSAVNIDHPDELSSTSPADQTAATLKSIDEHLGDAQARLRAGIIERRMAAVNRDGVVARAQLVEARADIVDGLSRLPADALGWSELSWARLMLDDVQGARTAWRTAILFASYEPQYGLWRAELGFRLWFVLDDDDRGLLFEQIGAAWDHNPRLVADQAARSRFIADIIREAFADRPDDLAEFEYRLRQY